MGCPQESACLRAVLPAWPVPDVHRKVSALFPTRSHSRNKAEATLPGMQDLPLPSLGQHLPFRGAWAEARFRRSPGANWVQRGSVSSLCSLESSSLLPFSQRKSLVQNKTAHCGQHHCSSHVFVCCMPLHQMPNSD